MGKVAPLQVRDDLKNYFKFVSQIQESKGKTVGKIKCLHEACKEKQPRSYTQRAGWSTHIDHLLSEHNIDVKKVRGHEETGLLSHVSCAKKIDYSNDNCYSRNEPVQQQFMANLLDMVSVGGMPISMANHWTFAKMIRTFDSRIAIPSRRTIGRDLIKSSQKSLLKLKLELSEVDISSLHVSFNLWSARGHRSVMGAKAHFINKHWRLCHRTVGFDAFPATKTGANIRMYFRNILQNKWGLRPNQIGVVMADNASENICAFKPLQRNYETSEDEESEEEDVIDTNDAPEETNSIESDDVSGNESLVFQDMVPGEEEVDKIVDFIYEWQKTDLHRLGCSAHAIQLVVNECLRRNPECGIITKIMHSLLTFFNTSDLWHEELVKETGLSLIQPGDTRWNGTLLFLQRIIKDGYIGKLNNVLEKAASAPSSSKRKTRPPDLISPAVETTMKELCKLLLPFFELTQALQSDDVTSPLVITGVISLYKRVASIQCTVEYMTALKRSLCLTLAERFGSDVQYNYAGVGRKKALLQIFRSKHHILATFLHPGFKLQPFKVPLPEPYMLASYVSLEYAQNIIHDVYEAKREALPSYQPDVIPSAIAVPQTKDNLVFSCMLEIPSTTTQTPFERVNNSSDEITRYVSEPLLTMGKCPLEFWKQRENQDKFPILTLLARIYLGFPATSCGVERKFSEAGALCRARRARLNNTTIAALLTHRERRLLEHDSVNSKVN